MNIRKNLTESEEESFAKLQGWWSENGRYIIFGGILGIASVSGWKGWGYWTEQHQATAAELFFEYRQELQTESGGSGNEHAASLIELLELKYSDTPYASLAYEQLAKTHVEAAENEEAFEAMEKAVELVNDPVRLALITLRQARVLLALDKPKEVLKLVEEFRSQPGMTSLAEELRGDAFTRTGDLEAARGAYEAAIKNTRVRSDFLRMKLENLGE